MYFSKNSKVIIKKCNQFFNHEPNENNEDNKILKKFFKLKNQHELSEKMSLILFNMFDLDYAIKSNTRKKNVFASLLNSKLKGKERNTIKKIFKNKFKETLLLNELHFLNIYPNIYPKNPRIETMLLLIQQYDKNNIMFDKEKQNNVNNWIQRFDFSIKFYKFLNNDKNFIYKNPEFNISECIIENLILAYSYFPKIYYQYTKLKNKIKKYYCEFDFDHDYLKTIYMKSESQKNYDYDEFSKSGNILFDIDINLFLFEIEDNVKAFRKKPGNLNFNSLYNVLKEIIILPNIKFVTKGYLKSLLNNEIAFVPTTALNRIYSEYKSNIPYGFNKKLLYTEANLISKKLFGKSLGFNLYHLPEKNWSYTFILALTKNSILTINQIKNPYTLQEKPLDSKIFKRYPNFRKSNIKNDLIKKRLSLHKRKSLRNYANYVFYDFYKTKIFAGYFFLSSEALFNFEIKYNILITNESSKNSSDMIDESESDFDTLKSLNRKSSLSSSMSESSKSNTSSNKSKTISNHESNSIQSKSNRKKSDFKSSGMNINEQKYITEIKNSFDSVSHKACLFHSEESKKSILRKRSNPIIVNKLKSKKLKRKKSGLLDDNCSQNKMIPLLKLSKISLNLNSNMNNSPQLNKQKELMKRIQIYPKTVSEKKLGLKKNELNMEKNNNDIVEGSMIFSKNTLSEEKYMYSEFKNLKNIYENKSLKSSDSLKIESPELKSNIPFPSFYFNSNKNNK